MKNTKKTIKVTASPALVLRIKNLGLTPTRYFHALARLEMQRKDLAPV